MIVEFNDIKKLVLANHDIDSCYAYLKEACQTAEHICATGESSDKKTHDADDKRETCWEGLGEAIYYNGTELHEHLANYAFMVSPDRFENEIEEYILSVSKP